MPDPNSGTDDTTPFIRIFAPADRAQVEVPFSIVGETRPNVRLELWIGGTFNGDTLTGPDGQFSFVVKTPQPKYQIEIFQLEGKDRVVASKIEMKGPNTLRSRIPVAKLQLVSVPKLSLTPKDAAGKRSKSDLSTVDTFSQLGQVGSVDETRNRSIPPPIKSEKTFPELAEVPFPELPDEETEVEQQFESTGDDELSQTGRILAEAGMGTAVWLVATALIVSAEEGEFRQSDATNAAGIAHLFIPAAVFAAGEWSGADGSLSWTYAGGFLGSALSYGIAVASDEDGPISTTAIVLFPIIGSILFYEGTRHVVGFEDSPNNDDELEIKPAPPNKRRLIWSVAPSSDGIGIGFLGSF